MTVQQIDILRQIQGLAGVRSPRPTGGPQFAKVLQRTQQSVKFSAHAQARLASRNIEVTPEMQGKLERAVTGAAQKGSKDSLILLQNLAFVVNVPNRTVITAMDGSSMKENIITNIDSTVIAG